MGACGGSCRAGPRRTSETSGARVACLVLARALALTDEAMSSAGNGAQAHQPRRRRGMVGIQRPRCVGWLRDGLGEEMGHMG